MSGCATVACRTRRVAPWFVRTRDGGVPYASCGAAGCARVRRCHGGRGVAGCRGVVRRHWMRGDGGGASPVTRSWPVRAVVRRGVRRRGPCPMFLCLVVPGHGMRKAHRLGWAFLDVLVRRRATLPHPVGCSTIAVPGLSFRVRNGSGRLPWAMAAASLQFFVVPARGGGGCSGTGWWTRACVRVAVSCVRAGVSC